MTMPLLEGLDGVEKMSKSKGNYIAISDPPNDMFGKLMSISDDLMWKYFDLLSTRSEADIAGVRAEIAGGRNPRDAKVALANEITSRFHGPKAAEAAAADFDLRARGGIPEEIEAVTLEGAPLGIGAVLKQARLAPSTSEALRLVDGGGVRVDGGVVSDRALKLPAGTFVVQVGKRKFARVTLR
jgi:tyrosyl-tRNA synthetase